MAVNPEENLQHSNVPWILQHRCEPKGSHSQHLEMNSQFQRRIQRDLYLKKASVAQFDYFWGIWLFVVNLATFHEKWCYKFSFNNNSILLNSVYFQRSNTILQVLYE